MQINLAIGIMVLALAVMFPSVWSAEQAADVGQWKYFAPFTGDCKDL